MTVPTLPLSLSVTSAAGGDREHGAVRLSEAGETFGWQVDGSSEAFQRRLETITHTTLDALGEETVAPTQTSWRASERL